MGQELKDFVNAYAVGNKLTTSPLEKQQAAATIDETKARANYFNDRGGYYGARAGAMGANSDSTNFDNYLANNPNAIPPPGQAIPTPGGAPGATSASGPMPATSDVTDYITQAAKARGIDPNVALRVAQSEGLKNFTGDAGSSFGPYQLHYGNRAPGGNAVTGLGDKFTAVTGLRADDPKTWRQQVDFSLDEAAKGGWGPWHGWKGDPRAGLASARPIGIGKGAEALASADTTPPAQAVPPDASTGDISPEAFAKMTPAQQNAYYQSTGPNAKTATAAPAPASAIPTGTTPATPAPANSPIGTAASGPAAPLPQPGTPAFTAIMDSAHKGVLAAMKVMTTPDSPETAVPILGSDNYPANGKLLHSKLAASPADINKALDVVDPQHQFPEGLRRFLAVGKVWDFYANSGKSLDPQAEAKGANAAAQLVSGMQQQSQKYIALAQVAAQAGHTEEALRLAIKGYENIPDGRSLTAVPKDPKDPNAGYLVTQTDMATGKIIQQDVLPPATLLSGILQMSPRDFYGAITEAGGDRALADKQASTAALHQETSQAIPEDGSPVPVNSDNYAKMSATDVSAADAWHKFADAKSAGSKPMTPQELKEAQGLVGSDAYADYLKQFTNPDTQKILTTAAPQIQAAAGGIITNPSANKNILPNTAFDAAAGMLRVDPTTPAKPPFTAELVDKKNPDKGVKVTVEGVPPVVMRAVDFKALGDMWATASQAEVLKRGQAAQEEKARAARDAATKAQLGDAIHEVLTSKGPYNTVGPAGDVMRRPPVALPSFDRPIRPMGIPNE